MILSFNIDKAIENTVKRDRIVALIALAAVVTISWAFILTGAGMHTPALMTQPISTTSSVEMTMPAVWDLGYVGIMFVMWGVMMIAMMLPSAAPMVLLFATINRKQKEGGNPFVPTVVFASAYLVVWAGFSMIAVIVQWGLEYMALLTPMQASASYVFSGFLLLGAGIYQLTPLKQACLKHCRSPLQFILTNWRNGMSGALRMGIEHGAYCVGCCWFLMGLLFFGGVMNLYWIAGLAAFVFLEKCIPKGHWIGHIVGIGLIVWGIVVLSWAI